MWEWLATRCISLLEDLEERGEAVGVGVLEGSAHLRAGDLGARVARECGGEADASVISP